MGRGVDARQGHQVPAAPRRGAVTALDTGRVALAAQDRFDAAIGPAERVTFASVADFFDALRDAGNLDNSIKARLFHLRMALRIMVPDSDFAWITRPAGVALDSLLSQEPDDEPPPASSAALFKWGLDMMPDAPLPAERSAWLAFCRGFRDGVIIALLASRAPRLGSVAQMRVETNLFKLNGDYWVRLESAIVKNRRTLEYSLPPDMTPAIDRYLAEIRPVLLDTGATDALWGNGDGGAFTYRSIQTRINRLCARAFHKPFGPHAFRHALATTLAAHDPRNPGLAAVVLGITEGVVTAHYRKARQADAAMKLQADLQAERIRTQAAARRRRESIYMPS
jgi:integrase